MTFHSQVKCFYATENEKGILWPWNSTTGIHDESQVLIKFFIIHNQRAHDHVGMSTEIFCNRMHNDVCTQVQWILQVRRSKSIVDGYQDVFTFHQIDTALDVDNVH